MKKKGNQRVLIFGGTTEGRKVAQVLDAIGEPYLYSTKSQTKQEIEGEMIVGALDATAMKALVQDRGILCIIDAAHPFAEVLHETILSVSNELEIETIRFERQFSDLEEQENMVCFDSFEEMETALLDSHFSKILALTGVQTIDKLSRVWAEKELSFRILDTDQSRRVAEATGIPSDRIFPQEPTDSIENLQNLASRVNAEALLTKESGASGFFATKVAVAKALNIPLFVVRRKKWEGYNHVVSSQKHFLQVIYRLRKTLLKLEGELRFGYTTGSSVTAAAQSAFKAIMQKREQREEIVEIACGDLVPFLTFQESLSENSASYIVIKNGGDDADVTHGEEMGCKVELVDEPGIRFLQGEGVGRVTLPGLQVPVGGPAVNPVPRKMITKNLEACFELFDYEGGVEVTPFVPKGKELAKKTFNPRVGVVDGISILGTTGKVMAYSVDAFIGAIERQLEVAKKSGRSTVLATSGLRSENRLVPLYDANDLTAVHFGNFVGATLELCDSMKFDRVVVGLMLGKAVKLAEGNLDTHSKKVQINTSFLKNIARETGYNDTILSRIDKVKMANELPSFIPFKTDEPFYVHLAQLAKRVCLQKLSESVGLEMCLLSANHEEIIKV